MQGMDGTRIGALLEHRKTREWKCWEWQFEQRIRTWTDLVGRTGLPSSQTGRCREVVRRYPASITPYYLSLADWSVETDPIRRQCIPGVEEIEVSAGGVPDPLEEAIRMPVPGLIHRYPDRCLLLVTNRCATYCRHCNRKRLWKSPDPSRREGYYRRIIDYISRTPGIREVILSGGDPLTLPEPAIEDLLSRLSVIPHVEVLRIGSRAPVVMPMRITPGLCRMLKRYRPLWFNTQFNTAREVTQESAEACDRLLSAGIPVSNQSVLLKGVNDDPEEMRDLLHALQRISVRPYYLFQCDLVEGTDHFRVDLRRGIEMMEQIRTTTSGLCIPRYVLDTPGGMGKVPLHPGCRDAGEPHNFFDNCPEME
jgi:lysine 2,3-aminomutase